MAAFPGCCCFRARGSRDICHRAWRWGALRAGWSPGRPEAARGRLTERVRIAGQAEQPAYLLQGKLQRAQPPDETGLVHLVLVVAPGLGQRRPAATSAGVPVDRPDVGVPGDVGAVRQLPVVGVAVRVVIMGAGQDVEVATVRRMPLERLIIRDRDVAQRVVVVVHRELRQVVERVPDRVVELVPDRHPLPVGVDRDRLAGRVRPRIVDLHTGSAARQGLPRRIVVEVKARELRAIPAGRGRRLHPDVRAATRRLHRYLRTVTEAVEIHVARTNRVADQVGLRDRDIAVATALGELREVDPLVRIIERERLHHGAVGDRLVRIKAVDGLPRSNVIDVETEALAGSRRLWRAGVHPDGGGRRESTQTPRMIYAM